MNVQDVLDSDPGAIAAELTRLVGYVARLERRVKAVSQPRNGMTLQEEVEHLRFCLEEMKGQEATVEGLQDEFGMTKHEARLLAFLLEHPGRPKSYEAITAAMYFDQAGDWPDEKIIKVWACKVRKKVGRKIYLETIWGRGYLARRRMA